MEVPDSIDAIWRVVQSNLRDISFLRKRAFMIPRLNPKNAALWDSHRILQRGLVQKSQSVRKIKLTEWGAGEGIISLAAWRRSVRVVDSSRTTWQRQSRKDTCTVIKVINSADATNTPISTYTGWAPRKRSGIYILFTIIIIINKKKNSLAWIPIRLCRNIIKIIINSIYALSAFDVIV